MSEELRRAEFASIGAKHGTDKVHQHHYERFYPRYIKELGSIQDFAMVEIGTDRSQSLETWLEYFPSAHIYGMDIGIEFKGDRCAIFKGDQSRSDDIISFRRFVSAFHHKIYFVNDDGSHVPEHQVLTFNELFVNLLQPGGIYIIEDIETSYWKQGSLYGYNFKYGYQHQKSIIEIFKAIIDDINSEYLSSRDREIHSVVHQDISSEAKKMISTITFGANCIIITKKTLEELEMTGQPYRFGDFVR